VRPQHTSRTRADLIQIGTGRPPRVSLDRLDLGGSGSVHTLSGTCSADIRRTPLHFDIGVDADTCPPLATSQCDQQRRGQRRSDLRMVAHSILPITLPVGNALARWQRVGPLATDHSQGHTWRFHFTVSDRWPDIGGNALSWIYSTTDSSGRMI